ncbi:hypothetical protein [Asaia bogorensis]|uniref:hypothetical protein n=1 Tax=Asaia bogorensis TaxID=91915 RepID=UPI000EFAB596|nr:hypothetical protein [Asaia bogorensis]
MSERPEDADFSGIGDGEIAEQDQALAKLRADALATLTKEKEQLIRYRFVLFVGSGLVAVLFILIIVCLALYYIRGRFLLDLAEQADWHALLAADAIFVLLAFIPLSIFWTLARLVQKEQERDLAGDAPVLGSLSKVLDSAKDLVDTVKGALTGK